MRVFCVFFLVGFVWICFLVLGVGGGVEEVDIDNRGVRQTPNYRKIHTKNYKLHT